MPVRRVRPDEWERLRELRLRALRDEPHAFSAKYEDEAAETEAGWREWAASPVFVTDNWTGIVAAFTLEDGAARLIAMYVVPEARGSGIARELVTAVEDWAREEGAPKVLLWVKPDNGRAIALYERCGYRATGEVREEDGSLYYERYV
jgi:ribosomal protein S18 acetylase RimI-like enzyme